MKIGHVLDDRIDKPDGVQQVVRGLGEWARSQGHEVHYIVGETKDTSVVPNIHVAAKNLPVRFNGNRLSIPLPASQRKINKLMRELNLDVLHVHTPYSPFMGAKVIRASTSRVGVTGSFHVLPYNFLSRYGNRLLGTWLRGSLKRFDSLYAGTPAAAEFAKWSMHVPTDVLPHPVDFKHFNQARTTRTGKKLTVVFLGRLVPRKGAFNLVQAIAALPAEVLSKIVLHIGGQGEQRAVIERFIAEHKLQDTIVLDGFIQEAAKPAYLAQADIAIFPSTGGESFGISLLEPMAAGAGITVGGENSGYSAVLAQWPEALFDAKHISALTKYLAELIADDGLRLRIGTAQHNAVAAYDIDTIGQRWLKIYEAAIEAKSVPHGQ